MVKSFKIISVLVALGIFGVFAFASAEIIKSNYPRISKFEMTDSKTGVVYCMWLKGGLWNQVKATCDSDVVLKMGGPSGQKDNLQTTQTSDLNSDTKNLQSQIDDLKAQLLKQENVILDLQKKLNQDSSVDNSVKEERTPSEFIPEVEPENSPAEIEQLPPVLENETPQNESLLIEPQPEPEKVTPIIIIEKFLANSAMAIITPLGDFINFIFHR